MASPEVIKLYIEGLPPSPNQTQYKHWSKVRESKQDWQDRVGYTAIQAKVKNRIKSPFEKAHIHFVICVGDKRAHDPDNLNWSVSKPALDGLKSILIEDDSIDHVTLSYEYDRVRPKGFYILVEPK